MTTAIRGSPRNATSGTTATQPAAGYLSGSGSDAYYYSKSGMALAADFNWNTLSSYFTQKSMDNAGKVISGDGTTVVNVYYARRAYTLIFRTKIYQYGKRGWSETSNYYTYQSTPGVKYMQNVRDIWKTYADAPSISNPTSGMTANGEPNSGFRHWVAIGGGSYVTTQYVLESAMIDDPSGTTATLTVEWDISVQKSVAYIFDDPNQSAGKNYAMFYWQYYRQPESDGLSPKVLEGVTYVSSASSFNGVTYNYVFFYNRNTYSVSYDVNGGNAMPVTSLNFRYGANLSHPADPTRSGYTFTGWYLDQYGQTKFTDTTMPPRSTVLYAGWTPIKFAIACLMSEGGTNYATIGDIPYGTGATAPADPTRDGMKFAGWFYRDASNAEQRYVFGSAVYQDRTLYAKWYSAQAANYTVHYYIDGTTTDLVAVQNRTGMVGDTVLETRPDLYGYLVVGSATKSIVLSATAGANAVTFYYKPVTLISYSVRYVERETGDTLKATEVKYPGVLLREVTEYNRTILPNYNRVNLVGKFVYSGISSDTFEIVFEYDPILRYATADSSMGTVNSIYQVVKAKTGAPSAVTATPKAGYRLLKWIDESGATVSTSATFAPTFASSGAADQFESQTYTAVFEKVLAVTLTANSATRTYQGTSQSVSGWTADGLLDGDTIQNAASISAGVSGIGAGAYRAVFSAGNPAIVIRDGSGTDVTSRYVVNYIEGLLKIDPVAIAMKPKDAQKVYDGTELKATEYEITNGAFIGTDGIARAEFSGSQLYAGTSASSISGYTLKAGTTSSNYAITTANGTLTVTGAETGLTVSAASKGRAYDGTKLTDSSFTYTGTLAAGDYIVAAIEGEITNAGSVDNVVRSAKVYHEAGDTDVDVTANYRITPKNGTLTVDPVAIAMKPKDAQKVYDGTELKATEYEITNGAFIGTDGIARVTFGGSRINVGGGESMIADVTLTADAIPGNYVFTKGTGSLEVTARKIRIAAGSLSRAFDGTPLTCGAYEVFNLAATDKVISAHIVGSITDVGTRANVIDGAGHPDARRNDGRQGKLRHYLCQRTFGDHPGDRNARRDGLYRSVRRGPAQRDGIRDRRRW